MSDYQAENVRQFPQRTTIDETRPSPQHGGGGGGYTMNERVGRIEGTIDGLKHSHAMLIMCAGGFAAVFLGLAAIMVTLQVRTDSKVEALPAQINESVREANRAFSDALNAAIQATRQQQPQMIIVPPQAAPQK